MKIASYWHQSDSGVRCALCPRACLLNDGEWGLCGARRAENGVLYAKSYGRLLALNADPIEKKPLKRFLPGTQTLSLGFAGCNLFCYFCQNASLSRARPNERMPFTPPEAVVEAALREGFPSISYTYNEPLTNIEYVLETANMARAKGLKNILVTNGYCNPGPFEDALEVIDALNIDVKSFREDAFKRDTGGTLSVVLSNVEYAIKRAHVEVTALMVPGLCEAGDVEQIAKWLGGIDRAVPLHITRYHPVGPNQPPATDISAMQAAKARAERYMDTAFLGNVPTTHPPPGAQA